MVPTLVIWCMKTRLLVSGGDGDGSDGVVVGTMIVLFVGMFMKVGIIRMIIGGVLMMILIVLITRNDNDTKAESQKNETVIQKFKM